MLSHSSRKSPEEKQGETYNLLLVMASDPQVIEKTTICFSGWLASLALPKTTRVTVPEGEDAPPDRSPTRCFLDQGLIPKHGGIKFRSELFDRIVQDMVVMLGYDKGSMLSKMSVRKDILDTYTERELSGVYLVFFRIKMRQEYE